MILISPVEKDEIEKWDRERVCVGVCMCVWVKILSKVDLWEKVTFMQRLDI